MLSKFKFGNDMLTLTVGISVTQLIRCRWYIVVDSVRCVLLGLVLHVLSRYISNVGCTAASTMQV